MPYFFIKTSLLCILLGGVLSCDNNADQLSKEKPSMNAEYEIPTNCNFSSIGHSYSGNECSPIINKSGYTGLLINVPQIVEASDNMVIPLASTHRHDISQPFVISLAQRFKNSIVFVVVNKDTDQLYSGTLPDMERRIPPPAYLKDDNSESGNKIVRKEIIGGNVNVELVKLLRLPKNPARYFVYATVGTYKSNVLSVEVRRPGGNGSAQPGSKQISENKLVIEFIKKGHEFVVQGTFTIAKEDELYTQPDLYNRLVMVMQNSSGQLVFHPFKDKIVFEDDMKKTEQSVTGHFSFMANDIIKKRGVSKYYIMCSLGGNLSNIVTVDITNDVEINGNTLIIL